ncbi:hypothetical protein B446_06040 [Streptomyces collinus Tu 365]|uniref:Syndecan 1 n=2 Tax=Streptomyces collinus TaxID=42684 RepID=S5VBX3_STRC3|nr:hypothetical protein B446_06040 [Streptomyces collinus Tu 365]
MAWRDRLRRRAAAPDTARRPGADRSGAAGSGPAGDGPDRGTAGDGTDRGEPGGRGSSVPGDWDGGWRRTAPPQLTVARSPLGVSDGLAFRAGLASWQNPSFDSGLGHAVLSAAPTGLVRGVARPATPQATRAGGGPLLLRALRPEGAGDEADGASDAGSPASVAVRSPRSGTGAADGRPGRKPAVARSGGDSSATKRSSGDSPQTRGLASAESPAALSPSSPPVQRAALPGADPVVPPADPDHRTTAAPAIPLVRRVSVLPGTAADGGASRPVSRAPSGSGGRTPSGPAVRAVPVAPSLTVARRMSGPVRRVTALRPAATPAPGNATTAAVQRAATSEPSRAPLGAPSRELPDSVAPLTEDAPAPHTASGPALPVVQRQAEGPDVAGAQGAEPAASGGTRVRGGLGAPLSALPPSAELPGATAPGSGTSPGPTLPVVQRQADEMADTPRLHDSGAQNAPDGARVRGGLGAPLSALPPSAELPGATAPGSGTSPGPTLPVVQRQADEMADTPRLHDSGAQNAPDGARVRGGLGAPLSALPPSAELPGATAPTSSTVPGAAMPVVQRQADDTAGTSRPHEYGGGAQGTAHRAPNGARVRGGLGAPLSALPPSADVPGATASRAPAVQRAPAQGGKSHTTPLPSATVGDRTPATAGAEAPLLGAGDVVQRRSADDSSAGGAASPGGAGHGSGHATPLVMPSAAAPAAAVTPESPAGDVRLPGTRSGGPASSGGQRPRGPGSPSPVVVARAVAGATGGAQPHSAPPLTVTRPGAPSGPAAPRTLQLLPDRPLTLSTRATEGAAPPVAARSGGRPVVAARWPGVPAAPQADPGRPTPGPSPVAPATPQVRRAVAAPPAGRENPGVRGADSAGPAGSPSPVQRVPVVRPAPPGPGPVGPAPAVPARSLPVTAPQAPQLADRPANAPASAQPVPVVLPVTGGSGGTATPVQRDITDTTGAGLLMGATTKAERDRARGGSRPAATPSAAGLLMGDTAKKAPAHGRSRSSSTSSASGKNAEQRAEAPKDPGLDLDDLARRLLDPMARLLRTELRRGRERTGRPYDGRR